MAKARTIHEAVFRLSYDLSTQISPNVENQSSKLAPQEFRAMRHIWAQKESTLIGIAKMLKRDKGQVARLIDGLCRIEMIERVPNPKDGRSKLLILTPKGYQLFEKVEAIERSFSSQLTKGIDQESLDTFFLVADKILENLYDMD